MVSNTVKAVILAIAPIVVVILVFAIVLWRKSRRPSGQHRLPISEIRVPFSVYSIYPPPTHTWQPWDNIGNQQQYHTPSNPTHQPAPFPAPQTNQSAPSPTIPPTTHNPYTTGVYVHHVQPQPQSQSQPQSPPREEEQQSTNNQFSYEDLMSFDATGDDKHANCPICLGTLEEEPVSTGQCLHLIHTSCLKSWLAKDAMTACPICRLPYTDDGHAPAASVRSSAIASS